MSDGLNLRVALCDIDGGRFEDVIHALSLVDECERCAYFNQTLHGPDHEYRCRVMGGCIGATLHPHLTSYLNWKLGWIDEAQHLRNLSESV